MRKLKTNGSGDEVKTYYMSELSVMSGDHMHKAFVFPSISVCKTKIKSGYIDTFSAYANIFGCELRLLIFGGNGTARLCFSYAHAAAVFVLLIFSSI